MSEIVADWGGKIFFDGAHQIGLIAGGQFQDPLREGRGGDDRLGGQDVQRTAKRHHRLG